LKLQIKKSSTIYFVELFIFHHLCKMSSIHFGWFSLVFLSVAVDVQLGKISLQKVLYRH